MAFQERKGFKARWHDVVSDVLHDAGFPRSSSERKRPEAVGMRSRDAALFGKLRAGKKKVGTQTLSDFFDQLGTLLTSGIPVLQALHFARSAIKHERLNAILEDIAEKVHSGTALSQAFAGHDDVFDRVVIGMIQAAETSGNLEEVCRELAKSFAQRAEMRNKILQAIAYPALVLTFGIGTVLFVLTFIVPKLATVFDMWDTPLPLVTRILLGAASFLGHGGILVFAGIAVAGLIALRSLKPGKRQSITYSLLVKIPFVNRILFLTDLIQLSRTWSVLLRSGVPFIETVRSCREVLWSPEMRDSMQEVDEKAVRGVAVQEILRDVAWFPEMAQSLIIVGQETGTLHESFAKIASYYDRELDRKVKLLGTYLEPMLILAIGLIVGLLVAALLLPIFEMSLIVQ